MHAFGYKLQVTHTLSVSIPLSIKESTGRYIFPFGSQFRLTIHLSISRHGWQTSGRHGPGNLHGLIHKVGLFNVSACKKWEGLTTWHVFQIQFPYCPCLPPPHGFPRTPGMQTNTEGIAFTRIQQNQKASAAFLEQPAKFSRDAKENSFPS